VRGIDNLCKANNIPEGTRNMWVSSGADFGSVSDDLLQILQSRAASNKTATALGLSDNEARRFSLFKAIRAAANKGDWSNAGFELECTREVAKRLGRPPEEHKFFVPLEVQHLRESGQRRALAAFTDPMRRDITVGTASAGGYLVGTDNMSFIEVLRNRSVAYRMGARSLSGLTGNVTVPRQTAAATAVWLANEAATATESQQTFGQMALSPKTVGAYTEISRQLLLQSDPSAEGIVTADLGAVCAIAVDAGVLNGSGASGQPTGITNTAGIGTAAGATFAYSHVLSMQTDVANANVMPAAGGYVTTPTVAALAMQRQRFASTDTPLWAGNVWDGQVGGFAAMSSNQVTASSILFGDWSQIIVAEWGVLEVEVNPYANFQAGIIGIRAMVSIDVGLRYAAAFSQRTSVT
jgi:HK97 family phage major capsid protein